MGKHKEMVIDQMNSEVRMTENEFIEMFKKEGFELYKTKDIKPKLDFYYKTIAVGDTVVYKRTGDKRKVIKIVDGKFYFLNRPIEGFKSYIAEHLTKQ